MGDLRYRIGIESLTACEQKKSSIPRGGGGGIQNRCGPSHRYIQRILTATPSLPPYTPSQNRKRAFRSLLFLFSHKTIRLRFLPKTKPPDSSIPSYSPMTRMYLHNKTEIRPELGTECDNGAGEKGGWNEDGYVGLGGSRFIVGICGKGGKG